MHVYEQCLPSTPFPKAGERECLHNIELKLQNYMTAQQDFINFLNYTKKCDRVNNTLVAVCTIPDTKFIVHHANVRHNNYHANR
jgi:hypothetical protein